MTVYPRIPTVTLTGFTAFGSLCAGAEQPPSPTATSAPASSSALIDPKEFGAFLDGIVGAEMADLHIPGVVVVAVKDSQVILRKGYGLADVERKAPVQSD